MTRLRSNALPPLHGAPAKRPALKDFIDHRYIDAYFPDRQLDDRPRPNEQHYAAISQVQGEKQSKLADQYNVELAELQEKDDAEISQSHRQHESAIACERENNECLRQQQREHFASELVAAEGRAQSAEWHSPITTNALQQNFVRIANLQVLVSNAEHTRLRQAARLQDLERNLATANEACEVNDESVKTLEKAVGQASEQADVCGNQLAEQVAKFNDLEVNYRRSDAQNATLHQLLEDRSVAATNWAKHYQHELINKNDWLLAAKEYTEAQADNEQNFLHYMHYFDAIHNRADRLQDQVPHLRHQLRAHAHTVEAREQQNAAEIRRLQRAPEVATAPEPKDCEKSSLCLRNKHQYHNEKADLAIRVQQLGQNLQDSQQMIRALLNQCDELSEEKKVLTMENRALAVNVVSLHDLHDDRNAADQDESARMKLLHAFCQTEQDHKSRAFLELPYASTHNFLVEDKGYLDTQKEECKLPNSDTPSSVNAKDTDEGGPIDEENPVYGGVPIEQEDTVDEDDRVNGGVALHEEQPLDEEDSVVAEMRRMDQKEFHDLKIELEEAQDMLEEVMQRANSQRKGSDEKLKKHVGIENRLKAELKAEKKKVAEYEQLIEHMKKEMEAPPTPPGSDYATSSPGIDVSQFRSLEQANEVLEPEQCELKQQVKDKTELSQSLVDCARQPSCEVPPESHPTSITIYSPGSERVAEQIFDLQTQLSNKDTLINELEAEVEDLIAQLRDASTAKGAVPIPATEQGLSDGIERVDSQLKALDASITLLREQLQFCVKSCNSPNQLEKKKCEKNDQVGGLQTRATQLENTLRAVQEMHFQGLTISAHMNLQQQLDEERLAKQKIGDTAKKLEVCALQLQVDNADLKEAYSKLAAAFKAYKKDRIKNDMDMMYIRQDCDRAIENGAKCKTVRLLGEIEPLKRTIGTLQKMLASARKHTDLVIEINEGYHANFADASRVVQILKETLRNLLMKLWHWTDVDCEAWMENMAGLNVAEMVTSSKIEGSAVFGALSAGLLNVTEAADGMITSLVDHQVTITDLITASTAHQLDAIQLQADLDGEVAAHIDSINGMEGLQVAVNHADAHLEKKGKELELARIEIALTKQDYKNFRDGLLVAANNGGPEATMLEALNILQQQRDAAVARAEENAHLATHTQEIVDRCRRENDGCKSAADFHEHLVGVKEQQVEKLEKEVKMLKAELRGEEVIQPEPPRMRGRFAEALAETAVYVEGIVRGMHGDDPNVVWAEAGYRESEEDVEDESETF